jgi:hypothetical protein
MTTRRDIVIFLGAGFSFDAGLPVMSNFGTKSLEDYHGLQDHKSRNDREAAEMLVDAADVFYKFQDYCRNSPTITSADADNLETVFCIAEIMREAGLKKIPNMDIPLDKLIKNIKTWLWKIYQQCPLCNDKRKMVNPNLKTRQKIYNKFFDLLGKEICKRTTFVSTNYDLIFEYMSYKNGKPCAYPGTVSTIEVGCGTNYVSVNQDNYGDQLVLCKLHGSVNFFENSDNELFISIDLAGDKPILKSRIKADMASIFAVDAIAKIHQDHPSLTPAIIPPTYAKLEGKTWLKNIWFCAFNALSNADTIVFIGYSMPPTDGFMRALIHAALASKPRENMPDIFVIDPNSEVHKNYFKLFGNSYQNIGRHTLEWALEKELKRVLEIAINGRA